MHPVHTIGVRDAHSLASMQHLPVLRRWKGGGSNGATPGSHVPWTNAAELFGFPSRNTVGYELRQDRIKLVGLYATKERGRLSTTREDDVVEGSAGIFVSNDMP
jgi:hypothetical protein